MLTAITHLGKRGTLVIPAQLRQEFGLKEGDLIITEASPNGILLRPAMAVPVELYSKERQAEFLLSNAVDKKDYERIKKEVLAMGIDPSKIPHYHPKDNKK